MSNGEANCFGSFIAGDVRVPALERRDRPLVTDDDDAVPGHPGVELERRDADLQRLPERRQGVVGTKAARAAVAFEVEAWLRRRRNLPRAVRPSKTTAPAAIF